MIYKWPIFIIIVCVIHISCGDDKEAAPAAKDVTFGIVSEDSDNSLEVSDFTFTSTAVMKDNTGSYIYDIEYSFNIHNSGTEPLDLDSYFLQAILVKDSKSVPAGGISLSGTSIAPGSTQLMAHHFNSALISDPLDIEGYTLEVRVYKNPNFDTPLVFLIYLIHAQ